MMLLVMVVLLGLLGAPTFSTAELASPVPGRDREVGNLLVAAEITGVPGRQLQDEGPTCEGGIPGIQNTNVCCPASCGTCAGKGCTWRDGGGTFSGQEACCGGGVRSLNRVCSDTVGAPCVVPSGPTCEGGIPGIQNTDVCCPVSCGTCAGKGCTWRDGGGTFHGRDACCGGGVRALNRFCSDTVGAPCVVASSFPTDSTECVITLTKASTIPTPLGGSSLTVSSSPCEFDPAASFELHTVEGYLLEVVSGEYVNATTAKFTLPPLPKNTRAITVMTFSSAREVLVGPVPLSYTGALLEFPAASAANADGTSRSSVVTAPASDLRLAWNTSAISAGVVDIVLAVVDADADEPREVAAWVMKPNSGTFLIPAKALAGVDLEDGPVFFKVMGNIAVSPSSRLLQGASIYPEFVTTGVLSWTEGPEDDKSSAKLCGESAADNFSKCQCFFASEGLDTATGQRGVQLFESFDEGFRCPSTVRCILETKVFYGRHAVEELPPFLTSGWMSDPACPFDSCEFHTTAATEGAGDSSSTPMTCKRGVFALSYPSQPCQFHPGAEFCVRSYGATFGGEVTGYGNQCCYDSKGDLLTDTTTGGGNVARRAPELGIDVSTHVTEDVDPFNWCCGNGSALDSWLCQMYIETRPVDAGDGFHVRSRPDCWAAPAGGPLTSKSLSFSVEAPELQGSGVAKHKKIGIEWACRDGSRELNPWGHTTQSPRAGFYEDVSGGAELVFDVTVYVPAAVAAGIRCVALVVADEKVVIGGQEFVALADGTISAASVSPPNQGE